MNYSGNNMTLAHFQDFYYLQALQAGMSMAKTANPENEFRPSFAKLENDVNEAMQELASEMAKRIYAYLWYAAIGEAYYAQSQCPVFITNASNGSDINFAVYSPSPENVKILRAIFDQREWSSSYGGQAWKQIVEGMDLYGKVPDVAFVDHAADLEHNGGCVFNKGGEHYHGVNDDVMSPSYLKQFLNHKFSHDILNKPPAYTINTRVTRRTQTLAMRYHNVVNKIAAVQFLRVFNEWLTPYTFTWGSGNLVVHAKEDFRPSKRYECEKCGRAIGNDHRHNRGMCLCLDCYNRTRQPRVECENCRSYVHRCDTQYVDGEEQTWCDTCAWNYKVLCANCGCDFHKKNMQRTKDNEYLCPKCKDEFKCHTCHEYYYGKHEHPVYDYIDSDGVLTTENTFEWKNPIYLVTYKWQEGQPKHVTFEGHKNAETQLVAIQQCGGTGTITPLHTTHGTIRFMQGTWNRPKQSQFETDYYDLGNGLIIIDKAAFFGKSTKTYYSVTHMKSGSSLFDSQTFGNLDACLGVGLKLAKYDVWNGLRNPQDFQNLPESVKARILSEVK